MIIVRPQHDELPRSRECVLLHQVQLRVRLQGEGRGGRLLCLVFLPSLRLQDLLGLRRRGRPGLGGEGQVQR